MINMKYTAFGEFFRILRLKHREILNDAKEFLGVSCAYISSVECGRRPIPDGWKEKIIEHYRLDANGILELEKAIDESKDNIKIDLASATNLQKMVAIQFQRSFDDVDDDMAKKILKILEGKGKSGLQD